MSGVTGAQGLFRRGLGHRVPADQCRNHLGGVQEGLWRQIEAPKSGRFTVRRGELKTDQVVGCLGLKIPAQIAFYHACAGASRRSNRFTHAPHQ